MPRETLWALPLGAEGALGLPLGTGFLFTLVTSSEGQTGQSSLPHWGECGSPTA